VRAARGASQETARVLDSFCFAVLSVVTNLFIVNGSAMINRHGVE
jgi:hypothetical protein